MTIRTLVSIYRGVLAERGASWREPWKPLLPKAAVAASGLLLVALACFQTATQTQPDEPVPMRTLSASPTPTSTLEPTPRVVLRTPTKPPPLVDTTVANVPIEDVVFDTFAGGFIRLSEASEQLIEVLRDRIRPIYEPVYDSAQDADWLRDGDTVIGYVASSGTSYAYPVRMLNVHEIVNDVIDGVPVLVTYCPLCASGMVYNRQLDGQVLLFGNTSALYEFDLVMYDHETGSYWHQVIGDAIVGPLTGSRLELLPAMTTTWRQWRDLQPDTHVLSRDLGLLPAVPSGGTYDRDVTAGIADIVNQGRFRFPVTREKFDDRLRLGDLVFAIQVGESHKAYLLTGSPEEVINDEVGGESVVVIVRQGGSSASAYLRTLDGQTLSFGINGGVVEDVETGSAWDDGGRSVAGPTAGILLTPVPSRTSFWFSLVGALPGIELYRR